MNDDINEWCYINIFYLFAGLFSMFSSLVSGKTLTSGDIEPVLEKFRDTLIAKNVASEIANKLCTSVESKLVGKVRFHHLHNIVRILEKLLFRI